MNPDRWQEIWEHTFRSWDHVRDELKVLQDKDRETVRLMASPTWATLPDDVRAEYTALHDELVVEMHQIEVRLTAWETRLQGFGARLGLDPEPTDEA